MSATSAPRCARSTRPRAPESKGEADEIVTACARRGVTSAVAHRKRYNPTLPVVGRPITGGAIRKVHEGCSRGKEDARGGAGDFWVLGSLVEDINPVCRHHCCWRRYGSCSSLPYSQWWKSLHWQFHYWHCLFWKFLLG